MKDLEPAFLREKLIEGVKNLPVGLTSRATESFRRT